MVVRRGGGGQQAADRQRGREAHAWVSTFEQPRCGVSRPSAHALPACFLHLQTITTTSTSTSTSTSMDTSTVTSTSTRTRRTGTSTTTVGVWGQLGSQPVHLAACGLLLPGSSAGPTQLPAPACAAAANDTCHLSSSYPLLRPPPQAPQARPQARAAGDHRSPAVWHQVVCLRPPPRLPPAAVGACVPRSQQHRQSLLDRLPSPLYPSGLSSTGLPLVVAAG